MGIINQRLGNRAKANEFFKLALNHAIEQKNGYSLALAFQNLADTLKREEKIQYTMMAYQLFDSLGSRVNQLNTANVLARLYEEIGNYEQTSHFQNEILRLTEILNASSLRVRELELTNAEQELALSKISTQSARKNNWIIGIILGSLLLIGTVVFVLRQRISIAQLAERDQRIKALLQREELATLNAIMEGQETERKRIAQDLHDRLGSILSTIKLHFNTVNKELEAVKAQALVQYNQANELLDEAVAEVRKIAHDMISGVLEDFGLLAAVKNLAESINESKELEVEVLSFGFEDRLPRSLEIGIYRTIQELVSNVLKHAKASDLTIQLLRKGDNLNIVIEDDGIGFDPKLHQKKDGIGLTGAITRMEDLKGELLLDSAPGRGTIITLNIPV